ncbi:unnamed protein product [Arctogadus glacialis]
MRKRPFRHEDPEQRRKRRKNFSPNGPLDVTLPRQNVVQIPWQDVMEAGENAQQLCECFRRRPTSVRESAAESDLHGTELIQSQTYTVRAACAIMRGSASAPPAAAHQNRTGSFVLRARVRMRRTAWAPGVEPR